MADDVCRDLKLRWPCAQHRVPVTWPEIAQATLFQFTFYYIICYEFIRLRSALPSSSPPLPIIRASHGSGIVAWFWLACSPTACCTRNPHSRRQPALSLVHLRLADALCLTGRRGLGTRWGEQQ